MCKPHKRGWAKKNTNKVLSEIKEIEKEIEEITEEMEIDQLQDSEVGKWYDLKKKLYKRFWNE